MAAFSLLSALAHLGDPHIKYITRTARSEALIVRGTGCILTGRPRPRLGNALLWKRHYIRALESGYAPFRWLECCPGMQRYGAQGAHIEPPGPLPTHLRTVHMAYSECVPHLLTTPLAEWTAWPQVLCLMHATYILPLWLSESYHPTRYCFSAPVMILILAYISGSVFESTLGPGLPSPAWGCADSVLYLLW